MPIRPPLLAAVAGLALALPALAQQTAPPETAPNPASAQPAPAAQPADNSSDAVPTGAVSPGSAAAAVDNGDSDASVTETTGEDVPPPPPPVEIPDFARRDPTSVGRLDPVELGLGNDPWGGAEGKLLEGLMRRTATPLASRWSHIALRNALLAKARAPANLNPVDWVAERAWLLLRMGEADAARMLVAGVDVADFTPKMFQVAVQSALADGDPPALCPLGDGLRTVEPQIKPLVDAMCASLGGEPESAAAQIEAARRHGRIGGIDLILAEKVVGAGSNTGRAATVEWDPVDDLTAWRFGLATATGISPPDRLLQSATSQLRAWQARAPLLAPQQRLDSARIATGLGVFSSQSLVDLYSMIYDSTDPEDVATTDSWQLRQAFVGKTAEERLAAMRKLWSNDHDALQREASRAVLARAATLVAPDSKWQKDAPDLISSMLAAGFDQQAARWESAVSRMDNDDADKCWAMLALSAQSGSNVSTSRLSGFINRDKSADKRRSAFLVAGLAGLGRIDAQTADRLSRRNGLGLGFRSSWTTMIDGAAKRGQGGTVLVLAGTGFQTPAFGHLPAAHLLHVVTALERTGQDFTARMIAAEALSRT